MTSKTASATALSLAEASQRGSCIACVLQRRVPKALGPPISRGPGAPPPGLLFRRSLGGPQQGRAHARRCVLPGFSPRSLQNRRMTASSQPLLQVRGPYEDRTRIRNALRARDSESRASGLRGVSQSSVLVMRRVRSEVGAARRDGAQNLGPRGLFDSRRS